MDPKTFFDEHWDKWDDAQKEFFTGSLLGLLLFIGKDKIFFEEILPRLTNMADNYKVLK